MTISIIIPTFNNSKLTYSCIKSIIDFNIHYKIEIIVIDNGSTDDTQFVLKNFPSLNIIYNNSNLGFSKACNQGARASRSDFLIFLNNDTEVTSGWIDGLLGCVRSNFLAGVIGCKLLYPDNSIQHAGIVFGQSNVHHIYRHFHPKHPATNKQRKFQAVTGACMLVPRKLFLSLDGFDEAFINGFEDLDFCFRARNKGFNVIYTPESVVIHHESRTQGRHTYHDNNARLFTSRWLPKIVQDLDATYVEDGLCRLPAYENTFDGIWLEDTNPNPFWKKAKTMVTQGDHTEAEKAYELALKFNPYDIRRIFIAEELGDLYTAMGRHDDATQSYDAVLRIHPSDRLLNKILRIEKMRPS
jgi:GT2 family glycosyltransferase